MTGALPVEALRAMQEQVPAVADMLRQLGNPTRLLLLCRIAQRESPVAELERDLGMKQPGLSQQLAELRQAGLVRARRESRSIHYSVADPRVHALLDALHGIFCADAGDTPPGPPPRRTAAPATPVAADAAGFARLTRR